MKNKKQYLPELHLYGGDNICVICGQDKNQSNPICCICGEEIDFNHCAYWSTQGIKHSHIHCAEKEIDVYKVQVEGSGQSYYDDDFSIIGDLIKDLDYGESYIITKEKIPGKFLLLI